VGVTRGEGGWHSEEKGGYSKTKGKVSFQCQGPRTMEVHVERRHEIRPDEGKKRSVKIFLRGVKHSR